MTFFGEANEVSLQNYLKVQKIMIQKLSIQKQYTKQKKNNTFKILINKN